MCIAFVDIVINTTHINPYCFGSVEHDGIVLLCSIGCSYFDLGAICLLCRFHVCLCGLCLLDTLCCAAILTPLLVCCDKAIWYFSLHPLTLLFVGLLATFLAFVALRDLLPCLIAHYSASQRGTYLVPGLLCFLSTRRSLADVLAVFLCNTSFITSTGYNLVE